MTTPVELEPLIASCRAFALQTQPYGVSRVLNDAADAIEALTRTLPLSLMDTIVSCARDALGGLSELEERKFRAALSSTPPPVGDEHP